MSTLVVSLLVTALAASRAPVQERELCCEHFGSAIANLGDVDRDGVPDHAISCPLQGNVGPTECVWAFSGASGRPLWKRDAPQAGLWFGAWLRAIGDVNGDGAADLLASSWAMPVLVLSGLDGAVLGEVESPCRFQSSPPFDGVSDVDGDRRADFVVGNVLYSGATLAPLRVLAGPAPTAEADVSIVALDDLDGDGAREVAFATAGLGGCWLSFASTRTGESLLVVRQWKWGERIEEWYEDRWRSRLVSHRAPYFGLWMKRAGDFDGDGLADLFVGASESERALGATWVVSGRDATPIRLLELGPDAADAVGELGDLDGGGCIEIGHATPFAAWGITTVRQLFGPAAHWRWRDWQHDEFDSEWACLRIQVVEPAGDVDRDGRDDFLLGVVCTSDPGPPGRVILVSGAGGGEIRQYDTLTAVSAWSARR